MRCRRAFLSTGVARPNHRGDSWILHEDFEKASGRHFRLGHSWRLWCGIMQLPFWGQSEIASWPRDDSSATTTLPINSPFHTTQPKTSKCSSLQSLLRSNVFKHDPSDVVDCTPPVRQAAQLDRPGVGHLRVRRRLRQRKSCETFECE